MAGAHVAGEARARITRHFCRLAVWFSVSASAGVAGAAPELTAARDAQSSVDRYFSALLLGIQKSELPGGLEVVLNVERGAPLVSVSTTFRTGRAQGGSLPDLVDALRHRRTASGASDSAAAASDYALMRARGAASYQNAGWEHSTFTQVLPADELPFALWLEGQRLRPLPRLPEAARAVASEAERAFSLLGQEAHSVFELEQLAWAPAAGGEPDLKLLNDWFFAPKHAVLTITGDFDSDEALRLLGEHVDEAARAPEPKPAGAQHVPAAAQQHESAGAQHESTGEPSFDAASAQLSIGFVVAGVGDASHAAVTLAAALLERTDRDAPGALFASSGALALRVELNEARGRSLLTIHLSSPAASRAELTPKAVFDELRRVASRPITAPRLESLRKAVLLGWLDQFASLKQRGELLGRYQALHGDARLSAHYARDLAAVRASDVERVLATLTADRAVVLEPGALRKVAR